MAHVVQCVARVANMGRDMVDGNTQGGDIKGFGQLKKEPKAKQIRNTQQKCKTYNNGSKSLEIGVFPLEKCDFHRLCNIYVFV